MAAPGNNRDRTYTRWYQIRTTYPLCAGVTVLGCLTSLTVKATNAPGWLVKGRAGCRKGKAGVWFCDGGKRIKEPKQIDQNRSVNAFFSYTKVSGEHGADHPTGLIRWQDGLRPANERLGRQNIDLLYRAAETVDGVVRT